MRDMFGPPPPMPGVGHRPGSSTDGVLVPVPASPVSPFKASPISVAETSPKAWPSPPNPKQRTRSLSRRGTMIETLEPEAGTPGGKSVTAKPKGRPPGAKNKPK